MSKYTKGPWQVCNEYDVIGYGFEIRSHCQRYFLNPICKFTTNSDKQKEENKANARLIAAAPELLDACKVVVERLAGYDGAWEALSPAQRALVSFIKEAIQKAEGTL